VELLDTHIWVWWTSRSAKLAKRELHRLDRLSEEGNLSIASISLWEVANLVSLGRLKLTMPLAEWLDVASSPERIKVQPITAPIAAEVATLPASLHRDPADRLIIATARILSRKLRTRDQKIINSGLVEISG